MLSMIARPSHMRESIEIAYLQNVASDPVRLTLPGDFDEIGSWRCHRKYRTGMAAVMVQW